MALTVMLTEPAIRAHRYLERQVRKDLEAGGMQNRTPRPLPKSLR
jgi:hypothetical protein